MRALAVVGSLALATITTPAQAGDATVVTSPAPSATRITIYRDPFREGDPNLARLTGYALIAEDREIDLPAGAATVRFEGVAAGMLPESAIISGLPAGVREKNLDAHLLSPFTLYAASIGRPVTLHRQLANGTVTRDEPAIIRSGPDGAAVLQTARGFEVANCGPWADQLGWHDLPEGLTVRPTLAVQTTADKPTHVRVTLAYLAWGFDWQARYVVALRPDHRHADLTAWVTMANSDDTSFVGTRAAVVAGKPQFNDTPGDVPVADELNLSCTLSRPPPPPAVLAPPGIVSAPAPAMMMAVPPPPAGDEVIVTAQRVRKMVQAEALGDLKLYRVPVATTLGAHAQKQVALLDHRAMQVAIIHSAWLRNGAGGADVLVRTRNIKASGLGLPLPAGMTTVEEPYGRTAVPLADGKLTDHAVGEKVEFAAGTSAQVRWRAVSVRPSKHWLANKVSVTNANPWPVAFEGKLPLDWVLHKPSAPLVARDGARVWAVTIPAHGTRVLTYRLELQ